MTPADRRLMALWTEEGLMSEGIGPEAEWAPVLPPQAQARHQAYWSAVSSGIIPDNEHDEPYWMTQAATAELLNN